MNSADDHDRGPLVAGVDMIAVDRPRRRATQRRRARRKSRRRKPMRRRRAIANGGGSGFAFTGAPQSRCLKSHGAQCVGVAAAGSAQRIALHDHRVDDDAGAGVRAGTCRHWRRNAVADKRRDPHGVTFSPLLGDLRQAHPRTAASGSRETLRLARATDRVVRPRPRLLLPRTEIADDAVTFDALEARSGSSGDDGVLDMMAPHLQRGNGGH